MACEQVCAMLGCVDVIVRIIRRGQVYELVYNSDNTPNGALTNLQSVLVALYSTSLNVLAEAETLFSQGVARQTMHAILHPGEAKELIAELTKLETKLAQEVQVCESARGASADTHLEGLLRDLNAPLARIDDSVKELLTGMQAGERSDLLKWISGIPFGEHHDTVKNTRTPGTCEWLLRHQRFRDWEETSSSAILWLQGTREYII
jgi:hypothetical protein